MRMKVQDVINRIIDAQNADPFDAEVTTDVLTDAMELLKEQEQEIRVLKLARNIEHGACKGIKIQS